jgi:hypothetical protein
MAVLARLHVQNPKERPAKALKRFETAVVCNFLQAVLGFFKAATRSLYSEAFDVPTWGCSRVLEKDSRKVARAHARLRRKFFYREFLVQIVESPRLYLIRSVGDPTIVETARC